MKTWPATLKGPDNNVTITAVSTVKARKLESGRTERRRFGDGAPDLVAVRFQFDATDYAAFKEFFDWDLNIGVNWFTASWITTLGYSTHGARFFGYPQVSGIENDLIEVKANLLVQQTAYIEVSDTAWGV